MRKPEKVYDIARLECIVLDYEERLMNLQINADEGIAKELTKYLCDKAEIVVPQQLTTVLREKTDKSAEEIIELIEEGNTTATGIKIFNKPPTSIHEYQKWDDGYIEGFLRVSHLNSDYSNIDYFVWTYLRKNRLTNILHKFNKKLYAYERR